MTHSSIFGGSIGFGTGPYGAGGYDAPFPAGYYLSLYTSEYQLGNPIYGSLLTALANATAGTILGAANFGFTGTGYVVGDVLNVAGGTGGQVKVTAIIVGPGIPTGYSVVTPGTGYSPGFNIATTGGTGSGARLTIEVSTSSGTGYAVGDLVNVNDGIGGQLRVQTVAGGVPTSYVIVIPGSNYLSAAQVPTTATTGTGTGALVNITASPINPASPKLIGWTQALLQPLMDAGILACSMFESFDLNAAVGAQLDVLGQILGQSRIVNFPGNPTGSIQTVAPTLTPSGTGYVAGDLLNVSGGTGGQVQITAVASGVPTSYVITSPGTGYSVNLNEATTGGTGTGAHVAISVGAATPVYSLDDPTYRLVLKAKVGFNNWTGQPDYLYALWQVLFPGSLIEIVDNGNMTANVLLIGSFSPLLQFLIAEEIFLPRPQGVQYNFTFSGLPIFGFDLDTAFVAGFDTGLWG